MARIFISYSRADEAFVRNLARSLSDVGARVWIDVDDIPAGMNWSSAIQEGLDQCDVMLLIVSPNSAGSSNVQDEWQYYHTQRKAIVPVLLKRAQVHYQLARIQYVNFESQPFDTAFRQLHSELRRRGVDLQPLPGGDVPLPAQVPLTTREGEVESPAAVADRRRWTQIMLGTRSCQVSIAVATMALAAVCGAGVLFSGRIGAPMPNAEPTTGQIALAITATDTPLPTQPVTTVLPTTEALVITGEAQIVLQPTQDTSGSQFGISAEDMPTDIAPTATLEPGVLCEAAVQREEEVAVYTEPTISAAVVASLPTGTVVDVIDQATNPDDGQMWYKVDVALESNSYVGYVLAAAVVPVNGVCPTATPR